jgi:tRNA (adenine22-N1)-methyltransferase
VLPALGNRLTAIAKLVTRGGIIADIGCDHCYLPLRLVLDGTVRKAYAADVNPHPLAKAEENLRKFAVPKEKITPLLSDGLAALESETSLTDIVIAGMGG